MTPAQLADILLGATRCLAGALLHTGQASYLTALVHRRFLRHAERIGYPFEPLVAEDHPANGPFVPAIASLEAHDELMWMAPESSHLGQIRDEYLRVCATADTLGTAGW